MLHKESHKVANAGLDVGGAASQETQSKTIHKADGKSEALLKAAELHYQCLMGSLSNVVRIWTPGRDGNSKLN